MGALDRIVSPPAAGSSDSGASVDPITAAKARVLEFANLADWQALEKNLPSVFLRYPERRDRLLAEVRRQIAGHVTFERLSGGRWRIGHGGSVGVFGQAPAALLVAWEALQHGETQVRASPNATRNRLRAAATWIERLNAPLLAQQLRDLQVVKCDAPNVARVRARVPHTVM